MTSRKLRLSRQTWSGGWFSRSSPKNSVTRACRYPSTGQHDKEVRGNYSKIHIKLYIPSGVQ